MIKYFYASICCFLALGGYAQNVGINNTDPKSALDINGGLRLRPKTTPVSGTSVTLNSNQGYQFLNGTPTGNFTINFSPAPIEGQHAVITNTTIYNGNVFSIPIPSATTVELFYSNGAWKQIGSSQPLNKTAWSLNGNSDTDTSVNFIGTTDNVPLVFKVNNKRYGLLDAYNGNITFGTAAYSKFRIGEPYLNVAIGIDALLNDTTGNFNTAIGYSSMIFTKSAGAQNTAVGSFSLKNNLGNQNTALGSGAMEFHYSGSFNTAVGSYSYGNRLNGTGNTAIGYFSMYPNINRDNYGNYNTAVGMFSLRESKGSGAVAIGYKAAFSDTASDGIVAIGRSALQLSNGREGLLAIGDSALYKNGVGAVGIDQGTLNLAIGSKALFENTTGSRNTALGANALSNNVSGSSNTAIGLFSANSNFSAYGNTSLGNYSLFSNRVANNNVAIGSYAMAVYNPIADTRGENVAIGASALNYLKEGYGNVAIGRSAMLWGVSGIYNTAIGYFAGENNIGSGNVFIGSQAGKNSKSSNKLYLENTYYDSLDALIYGDFAADSLLLNAKTINKFSLNVRGNNALEMGYGAAGKQTDAGKICYGCFGDPAHWLGIVGGGLQANNGNDRVIKLWSEGGLRIRGNALPDANNFYSLGTSGQRWKEIWTNAGAINTSDANLKTNIQSSPYGLDEVMQMNPVQYNWKTNPDEDLQIGFLAQDIQKIIPEAVVVPANGDPLGMKYTELIPVLVKAIQELKEENERYKKRIEKLEAIKK